MNSKGQVNKILLGAIIFAALLALIFVGPLGGGFGKIKNFFDNTPNFNESSKDPSKIGLTRYDIPRDKVQLYDGESWSDLTKNVTFVGLSKVTSEAELNEVFENYYFDKSKRTDSREVLKNSKYIVLVSGLAKSSTTEFEWYETAYPNNVVRNAWNWLVGDANSWQSVDYKRGNLVLTVWNLDDSGKPASVGGFVFIGLDGNNRDTFQVEQTSSEASKWFGDTPEFSSEEKTQIQSKAILWRDSIFKDPAVTVQGSKFCLKKVGSSYLAEGKYIITDLNKPGANCNV